MKSGKFLIIAATLQLSGCGNPPTHNATWYDTGTTQYIDMPNPQERISVKVASREVEPYIAKCKAQVEELATISKIKPRPSDLKHQELSDIYLYANDPLAPDYQSAYMNCMDKNGWAIENHIDYGRLFLGGN